MTKYFYRPSTSHWSKLQLFLICASFFSGFYLFALFLILTGPVSAAPQEPVMTVTRLKELLATSPTGAVDATFKTVVKGAAIVTIPCVIEGIVPQAAADNGDVTAGCGLGQGRAEQAQICLRSSWTWGGSIWA